MTVYEGMFILDSTKYSRDPETVTSQINDLVSEHGGTVLVSQLWDERKLAYPIKKPAQGCILAHIFQHGRNGLSCLRTTMRIE